MDRQLFLASKKIMLTVVLLLAISYVQAQETKEPLTLTLDKALEIALSDNPTIKVAEEEIALKKVAKRRPGKVYCQRPALAEHGTIRLRQPR